MGMWIGVLGIAFALAMDAFAVSIATGIKLARPRPLQTLRMAVCFGAFQSAMPVVGWLSGQELAVFVAAWDHWVAFALLLAVGGKMIIEAPGGNDATVGDDNGAGNGGRGNNAEAGESIGSNRGGRKTSDPTRGATLVLLGLATSIDAFAVGMSMAMLQRPIWIACIVFGLVAAALSAVGMRYGGRLGRRAGSRAELIGGTVLILIGAATLLSHVMQ